MNVDNFCEDGLLFKVWFENKNGQLVSSKYMFSIDETEASVSEILSQAPYHLKVVDVTEVSYILKLKELEQAAN